MDEGIWELQTWNVNHFSLLNVVTVRKKKRGIARFSKL